MDHRLAAASKDIAVEVAIGSANGGIRRIKHDVEVQADAVKVETLVRRNLILATKDIRESSGEGQLEMSTEAPCMGRWLGRSIVEDEHNDYERQQQQCRGREGRERW